MATTLKHLETALVTIVPGAFTAFFKTGQRKTKAKNPTNMND